MWSPTQIESKPPRSAARAMARSSGQRTSRSTSGSWTPTRTRLAARAGSGRRPSRALEHGPQRLLRPGVVVEAEAGDPARDDRSNECCRLARAGRARHAADDVDRHSRPAALLADDRDAPLRVTRHLGGAVDAGAV